MQAHQLQGIEPDGSKAPGFALASELVLSLEVQEVLAKFFGRDQVGGFAVEVAEFEDAGPITQDAAFGQEEQAQIIKEAI